MSIADQAAADELRIFVDNDGRLYDKTATPIHRNLMAKRARGEYDHARAVQAFMYLTEAGAKKYVHDVEGGATPWHVMFSIPTRRETAAQLARSFEERAARGEYDHLLPKKYRDGSRATAKDKKVPKLPKTTAKSNAELEREIRGAVGKSPRLSRARQRANFGRPPA